MKIAIDPGHGMAGTGANGKIDEAAQAWKLSGYIVSELKTRGLDACLTRSQNEKPELDERAKRAKSNGCGAMISVHFNSGGGDGAEVYPQFYGDKTICTASKNLGQAILNAVVKAGQQSRGIKYQPNGDNTREYYGILYSARLEGIPSILLEMAFVDTVDALGFDTDIELKNWAKVIAGAIAGVYVIPEPVYAYSIVIEGKGTKIQAEAMLAAVRTAGFPAVLKY